MYIARFRAQEAVHRPGVDETRSQHCVILGDGRKLSRPFDAPLLSFLICQGIFLIEHGIMQLRYIFPPAWLPAGVFTGVTGIIGLEAELGLLRLLKTRVHT